MSSVTVSIIGFTYRPCGPFPCNDERTCGLSECFEKEKLSFAYPALERALAETYGEKVSLELVSLDKEIPEYVKELVAKEHPPLPIVLVNGELVPVGAISVPKISEYIDIALMKQH